MHDRFERVGRAHVDGHHGHRQRRTTGTDRQGAAPTGELTWKRVELGFVSAYVVVRGGQAAVVDTGVAGSADAIGTALQAAGTSWDQVSDVILTHHHGDHAGSLGEVVTRAARAAVHAGEADISRLTSPRQIVAAADGSDVLGLQVVATPGHTEGHISVFDRATRRAHRRGRTQQLGRA